MSIDQAKLGARVRSTRDFVGVPRGTQGVIVEDYGSGITIRWDKEGEVLDDGFDKKEELVFLELVEDVEFESVEPSKALASNVGSQAHITG
jgi:hypothetical protein